MASRVLTLEIDTAPHHPGTNFLRSGQNLYKQGKTEDTTIPNRTTESYLKTFSYTLTQLWGRSATSSRLSPWTTKLSQQSQYSSTSNPRWHELTGILLPVTLISIYGSFPPTISNTQHVRHRTRKVPSVTLRTLTSPAPAGLFPPPSRQPPSLSKDYRTSPLIVSSNHDRDDPSPSVNNSPVEN